jgi:hypothetical protein
MRGWTRSSASLSLAASLLVGCSELAKVSSNATEIQAESQALIDHGQAVGDKEVVTRAGRIHDLASDIHGRIPHLEDKTPAWLETIWWLAAAAVVLGICIVLWQTGLGTAIRVAIGWLPRRKVQDASLAAGMLDPSKPEDAREYVAARRASDPEFDAAWRRIHKKGSQ